MNKIINNFKTFLNESQGSVPPSPQEDRRRNFNLAKNAIESEGYQYKEKNNTLIVLSDEREAAFEEIKKVLEPQGFVHNPLGSGSSLGRIEIKDKNFGNAYILFKPIRRTAALVGNDYETELANKIIENYSDDGFSAQTAGAGHGSDLTILKDGSELTSVEVKTKMNADFGQFKVGYDISSGQWLPLKTSKFMENEEIYSPLVEKYILPWLNENASFEDTSDERLNIKNDQIVGIRPSLTTGILKRQLQTSWFPDRSDIQIAFDFSDISNFYAEKGDSYIQIGNAGLYALSDEAQQVFNVPLFSKLTIDSYLRIRIKPHAGNNGTHTFTVAVKLRGKYVRSSINLSKDEDMKKFIFSLK